MMKGASIQVVAWFPAETRGALAHWTLVAIVPEMVAGVAGLMVVGMNIWKGNYSGCGLVPSGDERGIGTLDIGCNSA